VTYAWFLVQFLLVPIAILLALLWWDRRRSIALPSTLSGFSLWKAILLHVAIAVTYTTPWDNYLVMSGVWWYDPSLVIGITLGWVPIEEYCFFILQPVLTGLWIGWLAARVRPAAVGRTSGARSRLATVVVLVPIWLFSALLLALGAEPLTYLALVLVWALPPLMLQLGFGADLLLRHRVLVLTGIGAPTIYLAMADMLAIGSGTWTINPERSTGVLIAPSLPLEEGVFFLMTNVLITCGVVLVISAESRARLARWRTVRVPAFGPG
jgi:lycopene beta-cyclase